MVSVIVATKNREESLKKCLRSLEKQSYRDFEIVVERGGNSLAQARQFGFEKAKGSIVIYIDDDVEVTKDWLKNILAPFKDPKVGGVSGPTLVSKNERKNRDVFRMNRGIVGWFYRNIILESREKEVGKICRSGMWTPGANFYMQATSGESCGPLPRSPFDVDYLEACNMALRRSLIEKVGGFDLGFKGTSEWCEVDLVMRIKRRMVFNPKAKVFHHVSREGVYKARENSKERMDNFLRYYFKHFKVNWRFIMAIFFLNGYWLYKKIWKNI